MVNEAIFGFSEFSPTFTTLEIDISTTPIKLTSFGKLLTKDSPVEIYIENYDIFTGEKILTPAYDNYLINPELAFDENIDTYTSLFQPNRLDFLAKRVIWDIGYITHAGIYAKHAPLYENVSEIHVSTDKQNWTLISQNTSTTPIEITWKGYVRYIMWRLGTKPAGTETNERGKLYELNVIGFTDIPETLAKGILLYAPDTNTDIVWITSNPLQKIFMRFPLEVGSSLFVEVDRSDRVSVYANSGTQKLYIIYI